MSVEQIKRELSVKRNWQRSVSEFGMSFKLVRNSTKTLILLGVLALTSCKKEQEGPAFPNHSTTPPIVIDELQMARFNGLEAYQIETAQWNLHQSNDPVGTNLCIRVECSKAIRQSEDTRFIGGIPHWELNLVKPAIEDATLVAGFKVSIPSSYDEKRGGWVTNFYFTSHEGSEENEIEVLARDGDRLLLRLSGEIVDVNHYDGSKPRSKIKVVSWFTRDAGTKRSMN